MSPQRPLNHCEHSFQTRRKFVGSLTLIRKTRFAPPPSTTASGPPLLEFMKQQASYLWNNKHRTKADIPNKAPVPMLTPKLRHIIRVPYPYFYSSCIPRQANGYGRAPPNFAPPLTAMRGAFGNQKERIIGPADSPNVTDVALKAASPATF
jgi:hypothetical protein